MMGAANRKLREDYSIIYIFANIWNSLFYLFFKGVVQAGLKLVILLPHPLASAPCQELENPFKEKKMRQFSDTFLNRKMIDRAVFAGKSRAAVEDRCRFETLSEYLQFLSWLPA